MPEAATFAHVVKFTEDKISAPWPPRASPMPERVHVGKVPLVRQKAKLIRLAVEEQNVSAVWLYVGKGGNHMRHQMRR